MFENFTLTHFYFILGSLAIVIPVFFGLIADYKRDHKFLVSTIIIVIIIISLFFISDYVLSLLAKLQH